MGRVKTTLKRCAQVFGVSLAGIGAYAAYDPGIRRECTFWKTTLPILCHYKFERWRATDKQDKQQRMNKLHEVYSDTAIELVLELGGLFIKGGQYLSTRPEYLPAIYREKLKQCQDKIPAVDVEIMQKIVIEELGEEMGGKLILGELLGAASIGQVHLANWNGEKVAVKVQYPDAEWKFKADLSCLELFTRLISDRDSEPMMQGFGEIYLAELDYKKEGRHLQIMHDKFMNDENWKNLVIVPKFIPEMSGEKILTMSFVEGEPLMDVLTKRFGKYEGKLKKLLKQTDTKEFETQNIMNISNNQAEVSNNQAEKIEENQKVNNDIQNSSINKNLPYEQTWFQWFFTKIIDVVGIDFILEMTVNLMDFFQFTQKNDESENNRDVNIDVDEKKLIKKQPTLNELQQILKLMIDIGGYQLFQCNIFNADPHPGNFLISPEGKIVLLDFGQCRELSHEDKICFANLFKNISSENEKDLAEAFRNCGVKTKNNSDFYTSVMAKLCFSNLQTWMLERDFHMDLHTKDQFTFFDTNLMMVVRVSLLLRGLCLILGKNVNISEIWTSYGNEFLATHDGSVTSHVNHQNLA